MGQNEKEQVASGTTKFLKLFLYFITLFLEA